jgi:pimeloyl-ACP methyl ester carboxylesterase
VTLPEGPGRKSARPLILLCAPASRRTSLKRHVREGAATHYRQIELDGLFHYADFGGDGPPIVLVHGLGGSHVNWLRLAPLLTGRGRVYAPDLAGFGRTPLTGRSASVQSQAHLLDRFLASVTGTPALVVGSSMGAVVAAHEAVANPAHVAGVVLVDPPLPLAGRRVDAAVARRFAAYAMPGLGERYVARQRRRLGPLGEVRQAIELSCAHPDRIPDSYLEAAVSMARERVGMPWADAAFLQGARSLLRLLRQPKAYAALLDRLDVPVLLLHGAADRQVPLAAAQKAAGRRPAWTFQVLPDAGHTPHVEVPDRAADAIIGWLDIAASTRPTGTAGAPREDGGEPVLGQ